MGLWNKGIFSFNTSKELSNAVFYYTCKVFGLRSGDEHRNLRKEQFQFAENENGKIVNFNGGACKTNSGGLRTMNKPFKQLTQFEDPTNPTSYYNILKKYLSLVPDRNDAFYFKPISNAGNPLIFASQVVGRNILDSYVSTMMKEAGYSGYFTNHSIKATLATNLYEKGYDEQLIQERTGHSSLVVRRYKRTSHLQHKKISSELDPPPPPPLVPLPPVSKITLTPAESEEVNEIKSILDDSEDFFEYDFSSQRTPTNKLKTDSKSPQQPQYNLRSTPKKTETNLESKSPQQTRCYLRITPKKTETPASSKYVENKSCGIKAPATSKSISTKTCDKEETSTYNLRKTPLKNATVVETKISEEQGDKNQHESSKKISMEEESEISDITSMITYTHKKYDYTRTQNVSVFHDGKKVSLCDHCGNDITNQQASFDMNLAEFLPPDCVIKPKDISVKGFTTRRGGQLIVKIDY